MGNYTTLRLHAIARYHAEPSTKHVEAELASYVPLNVLVTYTLLSPLISKVLAYSSAFRIF